MIKMPWTHRTAPNFMIEVTDACNLACRACYKKHGTTFKTLEHVQQDLDVGTRLRPVHTVTISGGEATLHPELCRIVERIKQRQVHVFLLTNGVLLDRERLVCLKQSGLDSILFHVDAGQCRPDLPQNPDFASIAKRLSELVGWAFECGLDVSVSATLYGNEPHFLRDMSQFFFRTPEITFLFISNGILPGRQGPAHEGERPFLQSDFDVNTLQAFFEAEYGIEPYAYIPAQDSNRISWLSYFVPVVYRGNGPGQRHTLFRMCSNRVDVWLMQVPRFLKGRYIHKTTQNPTLTLFRVALNALTSFHPIRGLRFFGAALLAGGGVRHKMIAYDSGPLRRADGSVEHCEYCPTAIVRGDALVPCCVADYGDGSEGNAP